MRLTDRTYTALTTPQRVAALFAALARYDFAEADRLADTAPRRYFEGADFSGDFHRIMHAATIALQRIDRALMVYVAAAGSVAVLTYRKGDDWIAEGEAMSQAAEAAKARVRGLWAALRVVLEPLGLDAAEVVGTIGDLTDLHREILEVEAEPDPELLDALRTIMG